MGVRLGFDIGGTFTDVFAVDETSGDIMQEKVPTTPEDFSGGAVNGIRKICENNDIAGEDITHLSHGTTVATNTMLEEDGAKTGLLTTDGFRDILAIGRENRQKLYDYSPDKNPTFVERKNRLGIPERMSAEGEVLEPLDEAAVEDAVDELVEDDIESIAVSLLNAYRNSEHESRVLELVEERVDVPVSLASSVMPEIKEYERTLSTVINAYVSPDTQAYVGELQNGLSELGIDNTLNLMQANGGVITPSNIEGRYLRLINSGPAGGVIGAKRSAEASDIDNIITLDMGGTSADASVVRNGEIETTTEGEIANLPLLFPQVDIRTVGAGGGSIAWLNRADVLQVGPKSSGADPGPACYGRGGTDPTVTDAALLLGYLDPDFFLGGDMDLDHEAAEDVVADLADEIGQGTVKMADGILDIATTNITQAIRLVTVEKGYDPRDFALTCFGGAGPMFATRIARKLDIGRVLIPTTPGVLSATGLSTANERFDFSKSKPMVVDDEAAEEMNAVYGELIGDAKASLGEFVADAMINRSVDLRYKGQTSQVNVAVPNREIDAAAIATVEERFHEQYAAMYGHANPDKILEGVTWRLEVVDEVEDIEKSPLVHEGDIDDAVKHHREIYVDGEFENVPVYDRYAIPAETTFDGPAIVEETESTIVVEATSEITVDGAGNLIISIEH